MLRDLFSLFPAYAGVIPIESCGEKEVLTFPRIRGGDPKFHDYFTSCLPFSPHTRGDPRILWDNFKHFIFSPHTRG